MGRSVSLVALAFVLLALAWGCEGEDGVGDTTMSSGSGVGGAGLGAGAGGGGRGGATHGAGGTAPPVEPLYVGVTPNTLTSPASASDVLLAELTTFAAGVRAVTLSQRYSDLDPLDLSALQARLASYAARELEVVLTILVVDRLADHRPGSVASLAWDDPANLAHMASLLDAIADLDLAAVVLGRATDAYLEENPGEQTAMLAFLEQSLAHLESVSSLPHGVGVRHVGASPPAIHQQLAALGDCAVFSYFPGAGDVVPSDLSPAKDLDWMIAQAGVRPIVIQAVGITSDESLGSSPDAQLHFLTGFFSALLPRRNAFEIVNIHQLHDLVPEACDALAAEQGAAPGDPAISYFCASGVRDIQGEPKPGWYGVLEATATFASP